MRLASRCSISTRPIEVSAMESARDIAKGLAKPGHECISAHARGAARHGPTEAEVAEAMSVVILKVGVLGVGA
jgi:alkylhydroperoxidase/carboxymuconolactone decarboxylase family protein YurZ